MLKFLPNFLRFVRHSRLFVALFLTIVGASCAQAEVSHFASPVSETQWQASGDMHACRLSLIIHNYGEVTFQKRAGLPEQFILRSWQRLFKPTEACLSMVPSPWQHDVEPKPIRCQPLKAGYKILHLEEKQTQELMGLLESGSFVRVAYEMKTLEHDRVQVDISSVNFRKAYADHLLCVGKLLPYNFESISHTAIPFESGHALLSSEGRESLVRIAEYLRAGAKINNIFIIGYADSVGRFSENKRLAGDRADVVRAYLIENGVDINLIHTKAVVGRGLRGRGPKYRRATVRLMH